MDRRCVCVVGVAGEDVVGDVDGVETTRLSVEGLACWCEMVVR